MPYLKLTTIAGLLFVVFLLTPHNSFAQEVQSCDLCGWCTTEQEKKPQDWNSCMQCIFPGKNINDSYDDPKPTIDPGYVYYPSHPEVSKNWTVFGCLDTKAGGFVSQIYQLIIAFGSGFAFLAIVYGGFKVLTAGGDPVQIQAGKHIIYGAITGILLIVFSVFLLSIVGVQIIKIPGFG